jgi:hypothetical protein
VPCLILDKTVDTTPTAHRQPISQLDELYLTLLRMSNTDFLGRAIETVKKAIENDTAGEYEKAYQLYYQSLELFMLALKWDKNQNSKVMIRGKMAEYMDRAEKLKGHLAGEDKGSKKKPAAVGSNGKVSGGSGKGGRVILHWLRHLKTVLGLCPGC